MPKRDARSSGGWKEKLRQQTAVLSCAWHRLLLKRHKLGTALLGRSDKPVLKDIRARERIVAR